MKKQDATQEIKYRLAILHLQSLLEKEVITIEQFKEIKVMLIKKYHPMIGELEIDE